MVSARQVFDSRGIPTIEAEVQTNSGIFRAIVPSGTSAGKHEALELRDGAKEFSGKGVRKAVSSVEKKIAPKLLKKDPSQQKQLDKLMVKLDGTQNKEKLGANAILSVSMALCRAGAAAQKKELFQYIGSLSGNKKFVLPVLQILLLEGGAHAHQSTDLQEFMVLPIGAKTFSEAMRFGIETYKALEGVLKKQGLSTNVGKEGAFAPKISSNDAALDLIVSAIEEAGFRPGKDLAIAIDAAASEFFGKGIYSFKSESRQMSSSELQQYYEELVKKYPLISIEDPFAEDDWQAFASLTDSIGSKVQIVGDDLLVSNEQRVERAIKEKACNALLLKPNQIGTVTEALGAAKLAMKRNWKVIVSHRSGDTEDAFIADLAVGIGCGQIKTGAPVRGERTAKYNQLLRIEEKLGSKAKFSNNIF